MGARQVFGNAANHVQHYDGDYPQVWQEVLDRSVMMFGCSVRMLRCAVFMCGRGQYDSTCGRLSMRWSGRKLAMVAQ